MMEFLANDLSLHGQYPTAVACMDAVRVLLAMRGSIHREGRVLRSSRRLLDRPATPEQAFREVVQHSTDRNIKSVLLRWLANQGPFWDDERLHGPDDWLEHQGMIVTDSSVGEAALALARGLERALLSLAPSAWTRTSLAVDWVRGAESRTRVLVENHWGLASLESRLVGLRRPLASWQDLVGWAHLDCPHLQLAHDVIRSLDGHPFVPGAAERFQILLGVLQRIKEHFTEDGRLDADGQRLLQDHFVGKKAWFSDSSDREKVDFKEQLTFSHPARPGERIFCPWHGKVKTPQLRVHFSFPVTRETPVFILYMGPKITKS